MIEKCQARCTSRRGAVTAQQPRKKQNNIFIYPKQSSRRREHRRRRKSSRRQRFKSQEGITSDSSSLCDEVPCCRIKRLKGIGCNKRRPSYSDSESISDFIKMPVGITNCALKTSFSLTSLRVGAQSDSPDHNSRFQSKMERPYHSLTKKSRKSNQNDNKEIWRKSWGSGISYDDKEFWEGFQADYNYLMSQNILEREVSKKHYPSDSGGTPTTPLVWSHSEFMDQFAQLFSWLTGIQDSVYCKQENVTDWKLRNERQEELHRQRFRLENFNEESKKLLERWPDLEEEISWRVKYVNEKWETVEAMMGNVRLDEGEDRICLEESNEGVDHEVKCLRKWIREMETKLQPLTFQLGWSRCELEKKTKEHLVLQRDIEAHGKIVSSVVKLCEKTESYSVLAHALERKYYEIYLRSLEWQCHIESLIDRQSNKNQANVNNDSDGEPLAKYPRYSYEVDLTPGKIKNGLLEESDWLMDTSTPLEMQEDWIKEEITIANTMVGSNAKRRHNGQKCEIPESIFGIGDSASSQALSKSSMLGTDSKNANIFFSREFSFASDNVTIPPKLSGESQRNGIDQPDAIKNAINTAIAPLINRRRSPNTGTFTYKHLDTDSDQENNNELMEEERSDEKNIKDDLDSKETESTSSEESWKYLTSGKPNAAVRLDFSDVNVVTNDSIKEVKYFSAKNIPRSWSERQSSKESIKELVDRADELIRFRMNEAKSSNARNARVKRWLKEGDAKTLDSCDASGEYTTEDSDEKDSQTSGEYDGSIATCRRSGSAEGILDEIPKFELRMRNKRHSMRTRPWSISTLSGLRRVRNAKPHLSMSESALNQMTSPCAKKDFLTPNGKEENVACGSGSLRKKRSRLKKKSMNRRCESGSDGISFSGSDSQQVRSPNKLYSNVRGLIKSGSFSGVCRKQSDSSFGPRKCCDSISGTETDEDANRVQYPAFRLGPEGGAVTVSNDSGKIQGEEQLSLNSDQVDWDNYQEKYQSEAYSEDLPDADAAKKLLEFGEDYGKYLDSQSDCPSSFGYYSFNRRRNKCDSDSEIELLHQSQRQLDISEDVFSKQDLISPSDLDEFIGTCKKNRECLMRLLDSIQDGLLSAKECKEINNLVERWGSLKTRAELHTARQLQKDMALLKDELARLAGRVQAMETNVTSREELDDKISQVKNELNAVREKRSKLLQANVSVHRFLSDTGHPASTLKDNVHDLYETWDATFQSVSSHLCNLQRLSQAWLEIEEHLSQLDQDMIKVLSSETPSIDLAVSVQDVARVLSEKVTGVKNPLIMDDSTTVNNPSPVLSTLSTEGSLSDSGISDSGSEQELREREKRLAKLKRLARQLETILAPGSQALLDISKRIEQAEAELRGLQLTCQNLIARTAGNELNPDFVLMATVVKKANSSKCPSRSSHGKRKKSSPGRQMHGGVNGGSGFPDDEPGKKKSWFWRVIRSALPFQLALVALLCVACLLEPHCCDALNNLGMSFSPQLRYDRGPPPV